MPTPRRLRRGFVRAWEQVEQRPPPPLDPAAPIQRKVRYLKIGESLMFDDPAKFETARRFIYRLGGKCQTQKIPGAGWKLWRTA